MRAHALGLITILAVALPQQAARAQAEPADVSDFHARVARFMATAVGTALPPGDTLLTWSPNPTLFHIVGGHVDSVRSALLRADRMLGLAQSRWASGVLTDFETRWTRGDSTLVALQGHREATGLRITGTRDTTLGLPALPWAVADYGMEEHLVPVLHSLAPAPTSRSIAVLRPYLLKWDTVSVTLEHRAGALIAVIAAGKARETLVVPADMRLLWAKRSDVVSELRPLEGTARYSEFVRLREALGSLP
jgi:hypothetical protein